MTQNLLTILSSVIVVQLLLLSIFLLTSKKGKRVSNFLLAVFFLLLTINLADGIIAFTGVYTHWPQLAHIEDGFVFLFGPVLYLYTLSIVYRDFSFQTKFLLHALPFVVFTIAYQIFYHVQSPENQLMIQQSIVNRSLPPGFYLSMIVIYTHVCIYIYLAYRHLSGYRKKIKESFSSIDRINLDWISFMLFAFAILLLISFIYTFVPVMGLRSWFEPLFFFGFILIFFFSITVMWKGLRQPEIFSGIEEPNEKPLRRYAESIGLEERAKFREEIEKIMAGEKLFLESDLTLEKLGSKTGYAPKRLSQLINESFQQNFFDLVNSFRINEAQRLFQISKDSRLTVSEVMYACGFNSKSSFNTIFKQKTGRTPSEFRKTLTQSNPQ